MATDTLWAIDTEDTDSLTLRAVVLHEVDGVGPCLFDYVFGEPQPYEWQTPSRAADNVTGSFLDLARAKFRAPRWALRRPALNAGQYHPLVWRPGAPAHYFLPDELRRRLSKDLAAANSLFRKLTRLFATIEPEDGQCAVYGHDIRELLILACTEVETAFKSVLHANDYPAGRWNTGDYVKLRDPMGLADYEVSLSGYHDWSNMRPFAGWANERPTGSLPWYDAYNATKHDRDAHFDRATLGDVMMAMAAVHVLLFARYGPPNDLGAVLPFVSTPLRDWLPESPFHVQDPRFRAVFARTRPDPDRVYIPASGRMRWEPVPLAL